MTVRIVRHADSRGREEVSGLASDAASRASAMRERPQRGQCSGQSGKAKKVYDKLNYNRWLKSKQKVDLRENIRLGRKTKDGRDVYL